MNKPNEMVEQFSESMCARFEGKLFSKPLLKEVVKEIQAFESAMRKLDYGFYYEDLKIDVEDREYLLTRDGGLYRLLINVND